MKLIVAVALMALAFTTGFTCSKNTPTEQPAQQSAPAQEQMTPPPAEAPAEGAPAAPAEGAPAEAAPAPAETK